MISATCFRSSNDRPGADRFRPRSCLFLPAVLFIAHFSKFIRPGAQRIGLSGDAGDFMAKAFKNPDGSIAFVVFNLAEKNISCTINRGGPSIPVNIQGQALQTIGIRN
jgi:glucosylceramidase